MKNSGKLIAPYTLFVDRNTGNSWEGVLSVRHVGGRFMFEKIPFRSGFPGVDEEWVVGRSPIPYLRELKQKQMWAHLKQINKNGQRYPFNEENDRIGWFLPFSDSQTELYTLRGPGKKKRTFIGLHNDNMPFAGTNGCVGFKADTPEQKAEGFALMYFMEQLGRQGYDILPIWCG